jgi:hypothetical protein
MTRIESDEIDLTMAALMESALETDWAEMDIRAQQELLDYIIELILKKRACLPLNIVFDSSKTSWHMVGEILDRARESGKEGLVAHHLVGATLQLRYPDIEVENYAFSTSDVQQGRLGDFLLGGTAFHITVAPMAGLFEKCRGNLLEGYRVYVIVPDRSVVGTRQIAEGIEPRKISVDSIESFVGGNVDELARFGREEMLEQFRALLLAYNGRVDAIEMDKSMLIEIPPSLR